MAVRAEYIVFKLYHPGVTAERFGYHAREILQTLAKFGYRMQLLSPAVSEGDGVFGWLSRAEGKEGYGVVVLAHREARGRRAPWQGCAEAGLGRLVARVDMTLGMR